MVIMPVWRNIRLIKKQREKEFLLELERLYYNHNFTICGDDEGLWIYDIGEESVMMVTKEIEEAINWLKEKR